MADTTTNKSGINVNNLAETIAAYAKVDKKIIVADFAQALRVSVDDYCKVITKVQGSYHFYHSVMSHVVQGFEPVWQALGEWHAKDAELKSYRQKINFPIVPADVLGTALAELYQENKESTGKEIVKIILRDLLSEITDDLELLSWIGEYDANKKAGNFGFSLNGWNKQIRDLLQNTDHPCYKIPLDALTDTNIYDQVQKFELAIPAKMKAKITAIHMSTKNAEKYSIDYKRNEGQIVTFKENNRTKSPLGNRAIIGHDNMDDDLIFATINGNMLKLIDVLGNNAGINDIQKSDYLIKIFSDFELGYAPGINEAFLVANFTDDTEGLGNEELMKLYYPAELVKLSA